jgi:hypothetical protein
MVSEPTGKLKSSFRLTAGKKYLHFRREADYSKGQGSKSIWSFVSRPQEFSMSTFRSPLAFVRFASLATIAIVVAATAAQVSGERRPAARAAEDKAVEVELFAAMEAGDVEVKLIPKDAKQGNVLITNKTDKPLKIQLPEAFAGVPALAQFGGGGFGGGGMGGMGGGGMGGMGMGGMGGGGNQGLGGGMGGMGGMGGGGMGGMGGGGFGGGGFGGGFFNLAPEKTGKIKVTTVCLEHGKNDPNPRIPYKIVPLDKFNNDPKVYEVCAMLGRGEIDQASAQAAAWHFTDEMSFQELVAKIGVKHLNGSTEPFFAPQNVLRAVQIAQEAQRRAQQRSSQEDSKSVSLSQR